MYYLVATIGIVGFFFMLLYFAFKLDEEHMWMRFIILALIFSALPLVPKTVLDAQQNCQYIMVNETIDPNSVHHYNYQQQCVTIEASTGVSFLKFAYLVQRLGFIYLIIYVMWRSLSQFHEQIKNWIVSATRRR